MNINEAVDPASGLETRSLPATKARPEETMILRDEAAIQHVVGEELKTAKDEIRLDKVRQVAALADIHYVRQKEGRGLYDTTPYTIQHIGHEPFVHPLGDTIVRSHDDEQMNASVKNLLRRPDV